MMRHLATTLAALALVSSVATAAPKGRQARAHFDRGVAAYTKGDFAAANAALAKSYAAEADEETLFAWAQTERKLGHCDKAIELYTKLLAMNLPDENKQVVKVQVDECKQILDEEKAAAAVVDPPVAPAASASGEQPAVTAPTEPARADESPAWWKDPVGGALVGAGVVGLAVGTVFLVQGSSADSEKANAATYDEYLELADRAESRGRIGLLATVAGGALVTAGIVWYVTRKPAATDRTVSGWIAPSAGGLALVGRF